VGLGWTGTAADWARALGLAFALLDLALLAIAWLSLRRAGPAPAAKPLLFVAVVLLPLTIVFFGHQYGLEAAKSVKACGACHVMTPYVRDLETPDSRTLAAIHFKNRFVQENHCYTCHADYGMFGTVKAKWEGLGHLVRYVSGRYALPLSTRHPYASARCLMCHAGSPRYLASPGHAGSRIAAGEVSCLDCHGPAHPREAGSARR
jgi:cytochrome c-type protein NapC